MEPHGQKERNRMRMSREREWRTKKREGKTVEIGGKE